MRMFSITTIMVDHIADVQNRCTDVFRQMCRTDAQMMLSKQITADGSVKGKDPWWSDQ